MSLSDYLRILRARRGGITPLDIEAATGVDKGLYRQMEQRYRAVGDDDTLRRLADFYDVPFEALRWRLDWPRKALSRALVQVIRENNPIRLELSDGQVVAGAVKWWDLGAIGVETPDGEWVVQRHAVEKWSPRAQEDTLAADADNDADVED